MSAEASVTQALEGVVAGLGLVLEEVRITPAGRRRVVRIVIDRDIGDVDVVGEATEPLSLDDVARATRVIEGRLDDTDVLGAQGYTLEVSSPGVSRPLTAPRHFQRNVTRLVRVSGTDGTTTRGRIVEADLAGVTIELPATRREPARRARIAYPAIAAGEVQVEFDRPADPSAGTPTPKEA